MTVDVTFNRTSVNVTFDMTFERHWLQYLMVRGASNISQIYINMNLKFEYLMVRPQSSRLKLCCEYVVLQVGKILVVDALTIEKVFCSDVNLFVFSAGRVPYLGG